MNSLERALLEKAGNDNGFEHIVSTDNHAVRLGSARHSAQVDIATNDEGLCVTITSLSTALLIGELKRNLPDMVLGTAGFMVSDHSQLAKILRRTADLAHALPNQAAHDYETRISEELAQLAPVFKGTEVERVVRQRIGQQVFRNAMLEYWGGACAVTGIKLPEVLRASHAKPWAKCASDAERLDVFNGFLFSANLDALFDRFLVSFDVTGQLLVSPDVGESERKVLGIDKPQHLRWLALEHLPYLAFHRQYFGKLQQL